MVQDDEIPPEVFESLRLLEAEGLLAAADLGKQLRDGPPVARRVCKRHRWQIGKWLCQCRKCGKVTGHWHATEDAKAKVERYLKENHGTAQPAQGG